MYQYICANCEFTWFESSILDMPICPKCRSEKVEIWEQPFSTNFKKDMMNLEEKVKTQTPKHYNFKIQPLDVIDDWGLDFYRGNAVKYIARAGHKDSAIEDIDKAIHYLELYKERILNGGSKKEK